MASAIRIDNGALYRTDLATSATTYELWGCEFMKIKNNLRYADSDRKGRIVEPTKLLPRFISLPLNSSIDLSLVHHSAA